MISFFEIIIILALITIQSIFGVGLLLFGTPSFLLLGYDFANTINILMPVSITISALQFFKSKISDRNFINQYNFSIVLNTNSTQDEQSKFFKFYSLFVLICFLAINIEKFIIHDLVNSLKVFRRYP